MAPFAIGIKGGFHRAFTAYTRALRSKPVTTQVVTTGLLWCERARQPAWRNQPPPAAVTGGAAEAALFSRAAGA